MQKTGRKDLEASKMCPLVSTKRKKKTDFMLHTAQKKIIYCKSVWLDVLDPNKTQNYWPIAVQKMNKKYNPESKKGVKFAHTVKEQMRQQSRKC